MAGSISCIQINMHKATLASVQLSQILGRESMVAFVTEPYTAYGKIVYLPTGYSVFPQVPLDPPPRAGLVLPSSWTMVELPQFSTRDSVAVLVTLGATKVLLVSGYCDITVNFRQGWLEDCVEYARSHSCQLVLAIDSNAHSGLLGPQTVSYTHLTLPTNREV